MAALLRKLRKAITDTERSAGVRDILARRRFNAIAGGSAEGSTFHVLRKSDGKTEFNQQLKKLLECPRGGNFGMLGRDYCGEINSNCSRVNKKTGERTIEINKSYFRNNMLSRAEFLLWFESKQTEEREGRSSRSKKKPTKLEIEYDRMDGFMTAYIKGKGADRTFYIDLVCSKYGKGRALLEEAERIAKKEDCKTTSLRAATAPLISLYRDRFGYERRANACKKYGRAERAALYEKGRRLDKSVPFVCRGKAEDECKKDKKAKKFCSWVEPRALKKIEKRRAYCRSKGGRNTVHMGAAEFDGRRMGTGDGWWMSKCLR